MDGLNKFKEYFADYTDNYVVIGGVHVVCMRICLRKIPA